MPESRTAADAQALLERSDFLWHQRFELAAGVFTPGINDISALVDACGLRRDLSGVSVLDVGTTNGGAAFELERLGADVTAIDLYPPDRFGFAQLREWLRSQVKFVEASIYDVEELGRFDIVLFWGVLYHLRHPLLAFDNVRSIVRQSVYCETVVADLQLGEALAPDPLVVFFRRDELNGDGSNWFAPTLRTLVDWSESSGFETRVLRTEPASLPQRVLLEMVPRSGPAEFEGISYEVPGARRPRLGS
jgi:tRNA (mo5U34)-methyltransferase